MRFLVIISLLPLVADQCGGVEIGVWGLAQWSVFRCGVEIAVGRGMWRSPLGMEISVGRWVRRSAQRSVYRFCSFMVRVVHLWVWFCWVFVGHLWVLFWQWWGDGQWSRGSLFEFCSLFGRWKWWWFQWKRDRGRELKIRERREMGENGYGFEIYYFIG